MTVKNQADIDNPTVLTGYLVDGNMNVPLDDRNRHYQAVQGWIAEGNIPEDAYTQEEIALYADQQAVQAIDDQVKAITVVYNGFTYSGSEESQAKMTTAMNILAGKGDNKTRNFKDIHGVQHKLNRDNYDDLLDMIEPLYENITDD